MMSAMVGGSAICKIPYQMIFADEDKLRQEPWLWFLDANVTLGRMDNAHHRADGAEDVGVASSRPFSLPAWRGHEET